MSEGLTALLDRRDTLLIELRALENKVAGLDMAIRIVASGMEEAARSDSGSGPTGEDTVGG